MQVLMLLHFRAPFVCVLDVAMQVPGTADIALFRTIVRFGYAKSATVLGLQCHRRLLSMSDRGAVKWGRGPAGRSGISCAAGA